MIYHGFLGDLGSVQSANVESIDNYEERLDFHYMARMKKSLFLTRIGQDSFAKLITLAIPKSLMIYHLNKYLSP